MYIYIYIYIYNAASAGARARGWQQARRQARRRAGAQARGRREGPRSRLQVARLGGGRGVINMSTCLEIPLCYLGRGGGQGDMGLMWGRWSGWLTAEETRCANCFLRARGQRGEYMSVRSRGAGAERGRWASEQGEEEGGRRKRGIQRTEPRTSESQMQTTSSKVSIATCLAALADVRETAFTALGGTICLTLLV